MVKYPTILVIICLFGHNVVTAKEVMVVSSLEEDLTENYSSFKNQPNLEMFDFDSEIWTNLPRNGRTEEPGPQYRAESIRPGRARLIESNSVVEYSLSTGSSLRLASYPANIIGAAELHFGDTLCLVGGYDQILKRGRRDVLCWNPMTPRDGGDNDEDNQLGGWVALPPMKQRRHLPGAVVMDGKLYVAGGYDPESHTFLSSVEVFDDVSQKWYRVHGMGHERADLQLVTLNGKLYALGGRRGRDFLSTVEEYDPILDKWKTIADMLEPRAKFGAVANDGRIFVAGGISGFRQLSQDDNLSSAEVLDPYEGIWRRAKSDMGSIHGPARAVVVKQE